MRSFPFTADVYLSLFETYNSTIWPAQVVAYGLGMLAVFLTLRPLAAGGRIVFGVLSTFWLWNGIAYHLMYFLQINFAALGFAVLFMLQGALFAAIAIGGRRSFRFRPDVLGWSGLIICLFALVAYPVLGWLAGHGWPRVAAFGVAPAPTVIFTFGMLLMLEGRVPLYLAVVPLLWSLAAGSSAVLLLGISEDSSVLLGGIVGFGLLVWKGRRPSAISAATP
jgi:Family of unknown function (DUF6064)